MKKYLLLTVTLLLLLSGCANSVSIGTLADPSPDQIIPAQSEGISLELPENEFPESPREIQTKVTNESDGAFEIGPFYHIEIMKKDKWYIMTYSDAVFLRDPHYRDGGSLIEGHSEIQQTFSVANLGVSLPAGQYRLVKTLLQRDPYHEVTIAAPFIVQK